MFVVCCSRCCSLFAVRCSSLLYDVVAVLLVVDVGCCLLSLLDLKGCFPV